MSDIEQRARDALNEVARERRHGLWHPTWSRDIDASLETVCRLIEQQDAFAREVSDMAKQVSVFINSTNPEHPRGQCGIALSRFILPDPVDPIEAQITKIIDDLAPAFTFEGGCLTDMRKGVMERLITRMRDCGLSIVPTVDGEGAK